MKKQAAKSETPFFSGSNVWITGLERHTEMLAVKMRFYSKHIVNVTSNVFRRPHFAPFISA